ncbi:unnamed protein product [Allacma fusca]|uniref:Major facilitator superfamily (MFS) profile domain-containing protein n=1 Tax=Allacma fusca TaxID=39272 RepID=A0A8J2KEN9_9HEXA|nr:unnamed protein product [Allacma fusca]
MAQVNSDGDIGKDVTSKKEEINWSKIPPDYIGIFPIVSGFFFIFFGYSLLETLATPVMIDQFGMDSAQAIKTIGVSTAISSVVALACFFTIPALCKRFDERKILIGLGLVPTLLGRVFFFPFGGPIAPMRIEGCMLNTTALTDLANKAACSNVPNAVWSVLQHGCPKEQTWCFEIPALSGIALGIGYAICTIGYPYSVVLLQTIFSKMVGPRPQGVWMGFLTGISSLARVVGPFFVTFIYTKYGTIATSGAVTGLIFISFVCILVVYKRLVPIKIPY